MAAKREIGFSNDVLGAAWTDPGQFRRVVPYGEYPMRIAEMVGVGWAKRHTAFADRLRNDGVSVVQMHGGMGGSGKEPWYDRAKIWGIEMFLPKPEFFEKTFPQLDIVLHVPAAQRLLRVDRVRRYAYAGSVSRWLVENHDPGLGGVSEAIAVSGRLEGRGLPSAVLVDVGHVTRRLQGKEFDHAWTTMTRYLARMTERPNAKIVALHIPIGTNKDDSLPDLSDGHRRDLVFSLGASVGRIIFEYQRKGIFGLLHLFNRDEQKERGRISSVLAGWGKAELFSR